MLVLEADVNKSQASCCRISCISYIDCFVAMTIHSWNMYRGNSLGAGDMSR